MKHHHGSPLLSILALSIIFGGMLPDSLWAQRRNSDPRTQRPPPPSRQSSPLQEAQNQIRQGQTQRGLQGLHNLAQKGSSDALRLEARYALGVALTDLRYDQLAAIQFVEVIRSGNSRFQKNSIERLSLLADRLGDETLLNYALSKVLISDLPEKNRDLVLLRLGENQLRQGQFVAAQNAFQKIDSGSKYFYQAQFNRGLALLEANQPAQAVPVFQNLYSLNASQAVQHPQRVAAQMAWARALYQAQDFNRSLEIYRKIPRDSEMWVDSIFESAWASFRATKFRTVLSQFQSLHSGFFEEHYQPESLLLRSLVYLYICQFDEMEKTIGLFEKDYYPIRNSLKRFLDQNRDPALFVDEFVKSGSSKSLPTRVVRFLYKEGDVRRGVEYLKKISDERKRLESLGSGSFSSYARSALDQRSRNARTAFGDLLQFRLKALLVDLEDLIEQAAFAKYEMIGGKKEQIKKKISEEASSTVDRNISRRFYIQNGFEYWPFQGEYWLDELGNYQYVGQSSCP